jgi:hypothetical protein
MSSTASTATMYHSAPAQSLSGHEDVSSMLSSSSGSTSSSSRPVNYISKAQIAAAASAANAAGGFRSVSGGTMQMPAISGVSTLHS